MKNFKITLLTLAISFFSLSLFAQNFGIKAGLNMANIIAKDDDENFSEDQKLNPGFNVGVMVDFPIAEMFSFETGLVLNTKGLAQEESFEEFGTTYESETKFNLFYLDVPLLGKATFNAGALDVFAKVGPYLGYGLSGKIKTKYKVAGVSQTEEEDIKWGDDEDANLERLDFGLLGGLGIQYNSFQLGLDYNFGLANMATDDENGFKATNRLLSISLGYWF